MIFELSLTKFLFVCARALVAAVIVNKHETKCSLLIELQLLFCSLLLLQIFVLKGVLNPNFRPFSFELKKN